MKINLQRVRTRPLIDPGGTEIILDFENGRHHMIRLSRDMTSLEIAKVLHRAAEDILNDLNLI